MAALAVSMVLSGCAGTSAIREPESVQAVDRERFLGTWYIIANVPYFAEKGKVATRVEYVKRSDGRVDDLFYFRRALDEPEQRWSGVAWPIDASNARWKARFIWPFTTEFRIVGIDAEYSVALIATPDAKLAWVYARTSTLSSERYEAALAELRERGVDSDKLVMVPQPPAPK